MDATIEKGRQMASEEEVKMIWEKTSELMNADGGDDDVSFRE